jgi:hypothetical protein
MKVGVTGLASKIPCEFRILCLAPTNTNQNRNSALITTTAVATVVSILGYPAQKAKGFGVSAKSGMRDLVDYTASVYPLLRKRRALWL